ncbi:MAG: addiction module protein [Lacipirellulaceae bacterium]
MDALNTQADEVLAQALALPVDQRAAVAERVWRSVVEESGSPPGGIALSEEQRAELDRCVEAYRADPTLLLSEEEFWRRLDEADGE